MIALKALRLIMMLGIAALLLASATLLLYGVVETIRHIVRLVVPGPEAMTNREIFLSSKADRSHPAGDHHAGRWHRPVFLVH